MDIINTPEIQLLDAAIQSRLYSMILLIDPSTNKFVYDFDEIEKWVSLLKIQRRK